MSDPLLCPNCKLTIPPGQGECPNCGTILSLDLVNEILPAPVEPVRKAARKSAPRKTGAVPLKPFEEMLAEAKRKEESDDLAGALAAYRRALAFAETRQKTDPSMKLAAQTLSLLIERTEQLLAQQSAARDLAAAPAAEPVPALETAPQVQAPAGPPVISASASEAPGVPTAAPPPVPESVKVEEHPTDSENIPWLFSESTPPPPPPRSKFDRTTWIFLGLGGILFLGLCCLVIGLALSGGDLSKLSFYSTHTPTPSWEITIRDSFDSNANAWPIVDNSSYECGIENMNMQDGKLVWDLYSSADCFWFEIPGTGVFSDFSYFVDVQRISGSAGSDYGIIFRDQELVEHYFFAIGDVNQTYAFFVFKSEGWVNLIEWTASTAILPGEVNRIGVVARGPEFQFFINGTLVATFTDSTLSSGTVGLAAEPREVGTEFILEFDNFELSGNP